MPDLVTHLCSALLPKAVLGGRYTGAFAVGAVFPDVGGRLPAILVHFARELGAPIGTWWKLPWYVLHMPVGGLLGCTLLALLFPERERPAVLGWLLGGFALHMVLDVMQHHHGEGYVLLWPLSAVRFELGWMASDFTVPIAPFLALLTAGAWWWRLRKGDSRH